jgi:GNAT superfamily N-acetyltransferase
MADTLATPADVLARAIETDRIYFEMGARILDLNGAALAWMPDISASPAAAVIHRVDPAKVAAAGAGWVENAERSLEQVGATLARIYLDGEDEALGALLRRAGYVAREELIFTGRMLSPPTELVLTPVSSDADWSRKLRFHRDCEIAPDGHDNDPHDWVALERTKSANGMDAFLAEIDGRPVGAIGAVWSEGLLRLKNILVHPQYRRRAVGRAMLGKLADLGRERGISEQCVLAVKGEAGEHFYRRVGLHPIGAQVEWSKQIGAAR